MDVEFCYPAGVTKRPTQIDPGFLELTFRVAREYAGWRADRFIANRIPRLSRTRVQRILKKFAFDEAGKQVKPNRVLREGEKITVYKMPPDEPDTPLHFDVIYEDEWLMAVDKPAGLPVHPTARYLKNTLTGLLEERYGPDRPILTHRLDAETSGIVLCSRGLESERLVKRMFAQRKVKKTYLAVVDGVMDPPSGRIEVTMGFDPDSVIRVKMACGPSHTSHALTEYSTLEVAGNRTLLEIKPRTGRQHQIRAHLAHVGFPIVGDKMYGPDENLFLEYIESGLTPDIEHRAGHKRHALHAFSLSFAHPFTGDEITIECPPPEDIRGLLE
jgi:23S rRNA pseudouridine1911/1915/1917 synthase